MAEPESVAALHQQLDVLWIRYLDSLDQYTQAQVSIKETLGKGFFSLAQANFTSSGRRYGQDYYDQRAVASTKVQIGNVATETFEVARAKIIAVETEVKPKKEPTTHLPTPEPENAQDEAESEKEKTHLPTPEPEEDHGEKAQTGEEQARLPSDPLRQFGILIPPALRSAQRSFAKAVQDESTVTKAINAARGMREVEVEIRKARKVLKKAEKKADGVVEVE